MKSIKKRKLGRQGGYSDFGWLKSQALDQSTLDILQLIEQDELAFIEKGEATEGNEELRLNLKQGTFYSTRATGHSIANIFVHIFKNHEHMLAAGFAALDIHEPVIVDIGANEGYYAFSMSKNKKAKVIAVEPNPIAYRLMKKNLIVNKRKNVEVLNKAIWKKSGQCDLTILPQVTSIGTVTPIASSFMYSALERTKKVTVDAITLSELIAFYKLKRIDILKIDIEGGEYEILKTSLSTLEIVDRIVVEYHNSEIRENIINLLCIGGGFLLLTHIQDRRDFGDLYFVKRSILPDES